MANISLYNAEGKTQGTIELEAKIFGVPAKSSVIHQVFIALMNNTRLPWADTKKRGEVRGGGKKPWKQKGTGRARHGSIRSPIWKGGGVTFGPLTVRNYHQKINKKMNRLAIRMCLSDKAVDGHLIAVESFPTDGKAGALVSLRSALPGSGRSTLFVTEGKDEAVLRGAGNLSRVRVVRAEDLNVRDLMNTQYCIASKPALEALTKRLTA